MLTIAFILPFCRYYQVGHGNARAVAVDDELNEREALGSNVWAY
jgi:hypothetical protein